MSKSYKIILRSSFFIFGFISLCISCNNESKNNTSKSPNFILIVADDQGWNGTSVKMMEEEPLSKSDYYETPNLEILANSGARFSNAYAAAPVCAPSRYSIQVGKTPARLSMIRVGMSTAHINHDKLLSIPKALKKINSSYVSAHFGKWGMGGSPKSFGYDQSDGPTKNRDGGFKNDGKQWQFNVKKDPKKIFSTTKRAIAFMEKSVKENTPFFLQISHYAVHSNLEMRENTLKKYQRKVKGKYQHNEGLAAMTENLDEGLGIILSKLKDLEIQENTYVIYISDNGSVPNVPGGKEYTYSYNYPLSRGKWDAMEGGIRIPFVISGPYIKSGSQLDQPISTCDILPTIFSLAGAKKDDIQNIDGGNLKPILFDNKIKKVKRDVNGIFFHVPYRNKIALNRPHSAARVGDFKLIKFYDNQELLLYNVVNDKKEINDLSKSLVTKAKNLENILDDYLKSVKAPRWQEGITWKNKTLSEYNSFH